MAAEVRQEEFEVYVGHPLHRHVTSAVPTASIHASAAKERCGREKELIRY